MNGSPPSTWELMAFAALMTATPGPNNLMLLASGVNFGLKRTAWHMAGILFGCMLLIGFTGAGLGWVFTEVALAQQLLKLLGSMYMLWLASFFWRQGGLAEVSVLKPIGFYEASVFQFFNPKAWLMAATVIAVFVPQGQHYTAGVVTTSLIFIATSLPCIFLWAAGGAGLRKWLNGQTRVRHLNRVMAVGAALSAILFWH